MAERHFCVSPMRPRVKLNPMNRMQGVIFFAAALLLASCAARKAGTEPEIVLVVPEAGQMGGKGFYVDFVDDVAPILESRCLVCHNTESGVTALSFERREYLIAQNDARHFVIPGEPERSSLFLVTVIPEHFAEAMPHAGHRLGKGDTWIMYQWILQGAEWPEDVVLRAPQAPARPKAKKKEPKESEIPPDAV